MDANSDKPLKDKVKEEMKKRKVSVLELSKETGIPSPRIYKWYQEGTNPKADDVVLLSKWLSGNLEKPLMVEEGESIYKPSMEVALLNLSESTNKLSDSNLINAKNIERLITILEFNLQGAKAAPIVFSDPGLNEGGEGFVQPSDNKAKSSKR
jgi:transcriptional regulator with XRE-family HTH domain